MHLPSGSRPGASGSHAISSENDCLVCSTFFRRILIESGEDPDRFQMNEREAAAAGVSADLSSGRIVASSQKEWRLAV